MRAVPAADGAKQQLRHCSASPECVAVCLCVSLINQLKDCDSFPLDRDHRLPNEELSGKNELCTL